MSKKDDSVGFAPKWAKKLPEGFLDSAESMSTDELKTQLVTCESTISNVETEMENDANLLAAKEVAKDLGGAYKETLACQKAKIKAIMWLLDGRGVA